MTSLEIRQSFMDFFKNKGHRIVPSAPVIPHGDPTLLFTNAGMNQFKDVFLGTGKRDYSRAADTQKCIRVSGKHNDLEEVGIDTYHHTFFEMLGNWSFGDYYKPEAIEWAWELLTKVWALSPERLHATVYRTDDEAFELWKRFLPESRIHRFDEKDNFWEMGETGPCGPCSEIHYDRTPDLSGGKLVNAGVPEVIEIWNLVFIQYNRKADGSLEELAAKHVDTGMGFERICSVIQGKNSNYDTDVFMPLINEISRISGKEYPAGLKHPDGIAMRVISDHIRTLAFAIADGTLPGNEGRGYVLRRILRRACRFARSLGFEEPVIYKLLPVLIDSSGSVFPELKNHVNTIEKVIISEERSFLQTLDRGLQIIENIMDKLLESNSREIPGEDAFQLYDTFGFPLDLTELIARERGFSVNKLQFDEKMRLQKERSRNARKNNAQEVEIPLIESKTEFTGYSELASEGKVIFCKENMVVLDKTPFYAESGGQVSDTGWLTLAGEKYDVFDVKKSGEAIVHICDRDVETSFGSPAFAEVDKSRRKRIMKNHTATHLLHEALGEVLGEHIKQSGSLVAPDYLRFDFNHFEKINDSQLQEIEQIVNKKIYEQKDIVTKILPIEEASKNPKVKMFFGDKYGDTVRVVSTDDKFSMEFCGGTHVSNTIEIGYFKITGESSIAAGVRRIEAITGIALEEYISDLQSKLAEKQNHIEELNERYKQLEKEINNLKLDSLKNNFDEWIRNADLFDSIRIIAKRTKLESIDQMRLAAENLRNSLGNNGAALIASVINEKVQLVCVVTDDLKTRLPAGKLVGAAAKKLGGGGGGNPHLATAGAKDVAGLNGLLSDFKDIVRQMLFP